MKDCFVKDFTVFSDFLKSCRCILFYLILIVLIYLFIFSVAFPNIYQTPLKIIYLPRELLRCYADHQYTKGGRCLWLHTMIYSHL